MKIHSWVDSIIGRNCNRSQHINQNDTFGHEQFDEKTCFLRYGLYPQFSVIKQLNWIMEGYSFDYPHTAGNFWIAHEHFQAKYHFTSINRTPRRHFD